MVDLIWYAWFSSLAPKPCFECSFADFIIWSQRRVQSKCAKKVKSAIVQVVLTAASPASQSNGCGSKQLHAAAAEGSLQLKTIAVQGYWDIVKHLRDIASD